MLGKDYLIREAEKNETSSILNLLEEHYLHEETISQRYFLKNKHRISQEEEINMIESIRKMVEILLTDCPCLVAVHKDSKKIVGIVILELNVDPSAERPVNLANFLQSLKSKVLIDLLRHIDTLHKNLGYQKTEKSVKLRFLSIDKNHRGKGLSKALLYESIEWSKRHGFGMVNGTFSSLLSRKAAKSVGLESIKDYNLQTLRDCDGQLIFADNSPNDIISIMVLKF